MGVLCVFRILFAVILISHHISQSHLYKDVNYSSFFVCSILYTLYHRLLVADCCTCEFCIDILFHMTCCICRIHSMETNDRPLHKLRIELTNFEIFYWRNLFTYLELDKNSYQTIFQIKSVAYFGQLPLNYRWKPTSRPKLCSSRSISYNEE